MQTVGLSVRMSNESNSKECLPPQYITCLACGSVGAASAGAVSVIVVIGDVEGYIKEFGYMGKQELQARGASLESGRAGRLRGVGRWRKGNGQRQKCVSVEVALLEGYFPLGVPPRSYLTRPASPWAEGAEQHLI